MEPIKRVGEQVDSGITEGAAYISPYLFIRSYSDIFTSSDDIG